MKEISISNKISYIEATEHPLSADIGIIRENGVTWLYDVGCGEAARFQPEGACRVVLSHFHQDHTGNVDSMQAEEIYGGGETIRHIHKGTMVTDSIRIGGLHIFPLPSSHCKGCLGLEVDDTYAFVGDALYSKVKDGCYVYNAQILRDEINVLKKLHAPYLLVSHHPGMIRNRADVIAELEAIYSRRDKNDAEIRIRRENDGVGELCFRLVRIDEANAVLALYDAVKGTPYCTWNEDYPCMEEIQHDLEAGNLFVLEAREGIIGAISIAPENELDEQNCWTAAEKAGEFARVVLHPAAQGRHLGKVLVGHVLDEMRRRGFAWVHIAVSIGNPPALRLYRSLGFDTVGRADLWGHAYDLCELKLNESANGGQGK